MEDSRYSQPVSGWQTMTNQWLNQLETLLTRFSHLGIGDDIDSFTLSESWSLYVYLTRMGISDDTES
jgi:hypothetical protein